MNRRLDLKRLLFSVSALVDLGQEITSAKDFPEKMRTALHVVSGMLSVPRAALLVHDARLGELEYVTGKGMEVRDPLRFPFPLRQIRKFASNEPFDIKELRDTPFYRDNAGQLARLHVKTIVPLFTKDEFVGVMTLGKRLSRDRYLRSERDVLKVAAHQLAVTLHNARLFAELAEKAEETQRLYREMRQIYRDTIQAFAAAIDAKDEYTRNHSFRVAHYAAAIARELKWDDHDVEAIYVAGLLHDIGKIIIDNRLINKGGDLTQQEREAIRRHPEVSYDILTKIKLPWKQVAHFIRHHHERPDGSGYPDSLADEDLSDGAKILALADAFDAMTTDRPYRAKLRVNEAVREIKRCTGTQFDRRISDVFLGILRRELNSERKAGAIFRHLRSLDASGLDVAGRRFDA
jgi:putative nucleotidyltransferase with HDIG domain